MTTASEAAPRLKRAGQEQRHANLFLIVIYNCHA
jgi:hypothetical protein